MIDNKTICTLPFNSVSIDGTSHLRTCCNSEAALWSENINTLSTDEIINSQPIQLIRKSLLSGRKDPACSRCWKMEAVGNSSFRNIANSDYNHGLATMSPDEFKEVIDYSNIRYLDITLGNKCNLACRMCHPGSSSLIGKQYIEMGYSNAKDPLIEFSKKGKKRILELITKADNLSSVYLLGGEPLINEFHDTIIDTLISLDKAKNISLRYSTNLHTNIEKHLEKWSNFKEVHVNVSIDGSDNVYEYIRWPGSWDKVHNNLRKVCDIAYHDKKIKASVAITAQNLNVGNIPTLITKIQDIRNLVSFHFIPVTGCNYIELTPTPVLKEAIKTLSTMYDPYNRIHELINYYETAILNKSKITHRQVTEFFYKQQAYDKIRKQNLFQTIPYFTDLAKEYDFKIW